MFKTIICGLLLATAIADPISPHVLRSDTHDTAYIINGTNAKSGDNPHMCSYQAKVKVHGLEKWEHNCGASIISKEWAITAAHCFDRRRNSISLACGSTIVTDPGQRFNITNVVIHRDYNITSNDKDIALIRIDGQFELGTKHMDSIELPQQDEPIAEGAVITTIGWGWLDEMGSEKPVILQTLDVPVVANDVCKRLYRNDGNITSHMFCAGFAQGERDACVGDSGGPAKLNGKLVGLVSWGHGCAQKNYPGVYTRVASLRDWIKEHSGV